MIDKNLQVTLQEKHFKENEVVLFAKPKILLCVSPNSLLIVTEGLEKDPIESIFRNVENL